MPLTEVPKEIERQFNVRVESVNVQDRIYTGYFKNNDLETALQNVCLPMSLHYSVNGKKVRIW